MAETTGDTNSLKLQLTPKTTKEVLKKVKSLVPGENLATQRAIADCAGTSQATINRIISQNLDMKKTIRPFSQTSSSNTSRSTVAVMQRMETETRIRAIPFTDISMRFSDAARMSFWLQIMITFARCII